jgi:molybdopterin converting factor small subunit
MEQFENLCLEHERLVEDAASITTNIARVDAFSPEAQKFVDDGIHLTEESMKIFIESTLAASETFFLNSHVNDEDEPSAMDTFSSGIIEIKSVEDRVSDLERQLFEIKNKFQEKSSSDNLMMARICEELDMFLNNRKEDRVVMTGLTNSVIMPHEGEEKKKWLQDMVKKILDVIEPNPKGKILFVNPGKRDGQNIPMIEVKMDSKEAARSIRRSFVLMKKNGHDFGRLHLANSVTLGTRVQTDILRAIAN